MPQAKHGRKSVDVFAVDGSNSGGTGLENEHIGQIHVAFKRFGDRLFRCVAKGCGRGEWSFEDTAVPALADLSRFFFDGLG